MALRSVLTGSTTTAAGRRPRPRGKSLAVLPFLNPAADPQIEYIADGITESIINSLSQLSGVRVIPRSVAMVPFMYAMVLQKLGRIEEPIDHVERMIEMHTGGCVFLGVDPGLTGLVGHPRFEAAVKRVGVPLQRRASAAHTAST